MNKGLALIFVVVLPRTLIIKLPRINHLVEYIFLKICYEFPIYVTSSVRIKNVLSTGVDFFYPLIERIEHFLFTLRTISDDKEIDHFRNRSGKTVRK